MEFRSVLTADERAEVSHLDLNDSGNPPIQCFSPEEAHVRLEELQRRVEVLEAKLGMAPVSICFIRSRQLFTGIYVRHTLCRLFDTSTDPSVVISNDDDLVPMNQDVAETLTPSSTARPEFPLSVRPSGSLSDSRLLRTIVPRTTHPIHTRAAPERHQRLSHPMHIRAQKRTTGKWLTERPL